MTSGTWAGRAAAAWARAGGRVRAGRPGQPAGRAGLGRGGAGDELGDALADEVVGAVQGELHPIEKNLFRTGAGIRRSLAVLDGLWADAVPALGGDDPRAALRSREAAAMTAVARWCYRAALARAETRGMHLREDRPVTSEDFSHRLVTTGLERVEVRPYEERGQSDATSGRIPA